MDRRTLLLSLGAAAATGSGCLVADDDRTNDDGTDDHASDEGDGADDSDADGDGWGPDVDDLRVDDEPAADRTVRMTHTGGFVPDVAWVTLGGEVTWRNTDDADHHDAVSLPGRVPADAEGWASGSLDHQESFTHAFTEPGVYDYVCTPHQTWMYGTVVVGTPDPESEPGLADPDEDDAVPEPVIRSLNLAAEQLLRDERG